MSDYLSTPEIELAVARWIGVRSHLVVPNVSWGLYVHECDLLSLSRSGYATEVEIKVSVSDLRADQHKRHKHDDDRIRYLYFALPLRMENCAVVVPERAGVILVSRFGRCVVRRRAKPNPDAHKWTDEDRLQLARLGTLRIWGLKERLFVEKTGECDYQI